MKSRGFVPHPVPFSVWKQVSRPYNDLREFPLQSRVIAYKRHPCEIRTAQCTGRDQTSAPESEPPPSWHGTTLLLGEAHTYRSLVEIDAVHALTPVLDGFHGVIRPLPESVRLQGKGGQIPDPAPGSENAP